MGGWAACVPAPPLEPPTAPEVSHLGLELCGLQRGTCGAKGMREERGGGEAGTDESMLHEKRPGLHRGCGVRLYGAWVLQLGGGRGGGGEAAQRTLARVGTGAGARLASQPQRASAEDQLPQSGGTRRSNNSNNMAVATAQPPNCQPSTANHRPVAGSLTARRCAMRQCGAGGAERMSSTAACTIWSYSSRTARKSRASCAWSCVRALGEGGPPAAWVTGRAAWPGLA